MRKASSRKQSAASAPDADIVEKACCSAKEMEERLQEIAREAGRKAYGLVNSADNEIFSATDYVASRIREKPVQAGAIALGVGLLLGYLFRGSRSSSDRKNVDHQ